jgi:hypothetical protein
MAILSVEDVSIITSPDDMSTLKDKNNLANKAGRPPYYFVYFLREKKIQAFSISQQITAHM